MARDGRYRGPHAGDFLRDERILRDQLIRSVAGLQCGQQMALGDPGRKAVLLAVVNFGGR